MPDKPDAARSVAETLASMLTAGAAVAATAAGAPVMLVGMSAEVVKGLFKYLIAQMAGRPDPKGILHRIRDDRTAHTVETIRDALVAAMGLRPDFAEPIEELADAVQACEDGRDEKRFQMALLTLFRAVTEAGPILKDIKADTAYISDIRDTVKCIKAAVVVPQVTDEGTYATQHYLKMRVESLTSEVRHLLDAEGKAKWDQISTAMAERSWRQAFELAADMERWLDEQGGKISAEVKIQGLLVLADVAVIKDSGFPFDDRRDVPEAFRLLAKAEAVATTDIDNETASRLLRVRAKLIYIKGDRNRAHEILDGLSDLGAISLRLGMMEEEGRWSEASDFAAAKDEPNKKWAASAVAVHVKAGHIDRAEAILDWANGQQALTRKACTLTFVQTRCANIIGDGTPNSRRSLTATDRDVLRHLQTMLHEVFGAAFADGPSSGIDAEALQAAIVFGHILRDFQACQDAADHLAKWKPVMPEIGRAVLRGDVANVKGLADRFLNEHGDIFLTQLIAASLMIEVEDNADRALDLLLPMLDGAGADQREEIARTVLIGSQYCNADAVRGAHQRIVGTLGAEHRLTVMLEAVLLAKKGSLPEARSTIEPLSDDDDYIWLQLAAALAVQQNAWADAAKLLHRISELTGHPEVYQREAEAWYRTGEIEKAVEPLQKAHQLLPGDSEIVRNLAAAYHRAGRFADAASMYDTLWRTERHTQSLAINYANALVQSGNVPKAIEILKTYIAGAGGEVDLIPLLGCTHLLHAQGDASGGLDLLLPRWDRLNGDHRYLMAVMQLGHASGREEDADRAFKTLVGMLNRGTLPEGLLTKYTLDDMLAMHQQWDKRRKHVDGLYLSGRLPWLIASNWIQPTNHAYLSWLIRTQPLIPSDHPENAAEYSLYSTNGFTAADVEGHRHLAPVTAPERGAEIVADLSALITLHRLGLLHPACAYFSKVYLPQSYHAAWVEEQARIPHHQPRQVESQQAVVRAVSDRRISVSTSTSNTMPRLDEYEDTPGVAPVVRILQVVKWLASKGQLTATQRAAVESRHNRPAVISDADANYALEAGTVLAKPLTFQTIHELGLLDDVCRGLRVFVEPDDLRECEDDLASQKARDQAGQWYRELISTVESITNVEFVPLKANDKESHQGSGQSEDANGEHVTIHLGVDAALLAQQMNRPLLADDRYCQQALFNSRRDDPKAAFGTDTLIAALHAEGMVATADQADHFLRLIRWRYKFLLPEVGILLEMAARFKDGLPGTQLREIAGYVQDCMRDAGSYGGPEQVDPPVSMALKLFKGWVDKLAEFIVELWWDERFTEEQAARLTRWTTRYCLPAWSCNIPLQNWRRAAYIRRHTLLGAILTHLWRKEDLRKANRVISRVRRSIGIRDDELASCAELAMRSMMTAFVDQDMEVVRRIIARVLKVVYNTPMIPWRLLPVAQQVGLVNPANKRTDVTDEDVAIIRDRHHLKRLAPLEGPFAYSLEGNKHVVASFLPEALCSPLTELRHAAIENILPQTFCPKTGNTQKVLEESVDSIRADDVSVWVPAVSRALEPLKEDFSLNMVGFRQAFEVNHDDGCTKCWANLIGPTAESLLAVDCDGWQLLPTGENAEGSLLAVCGEALSVEQLLTSYDRCAGHLTLAPPYDLGTQLQELIKRSGHEGKVWAGLREWLFDQRRPWRQYHGCQALLKNIDHVPPDQQESFWNLLVAIIEMSRGDKNDSDEAQVWRLEAELAAHYLRTIDLGGYGLEANRPLTASWWASRAVTELLASGLPLEKVAGQVRQWRSDLIPCGTLITHHAWALTSPKPYSPSRFAVLNEKAPRSIALLLALGEFAKVAGVNSVPTSVRQRLCICFANALAIGDTVVMADGDGLWMWQRSRIEATKAFLSALPEGEGTEGLAQAVAHVEGLADPSSVKKAMEQLPTRTGADAVLLCASTRSHCYRNSDAGDVIRPFLRNTEWRNTCAKTIPLLGWDVLAQGLFVLQVRGGADWAVEVPYVFLRLVEACRDDGDRATAFLEYLLMSAAASNTGGALKALLASKCLPELRPHMKKVKDGIEKMAHVADPAVGLQMQMSLTFCEQF